MREIDDLLLVQSEKDREFVDREADLLGVGQRSLLRREEKIQAVGDAAFQGVRERTFRIGDAVREESVDVVAGNTVGLVVALERDRALESRSLLPRRRRHVDSQGVRDERGSERVAHDVVPGVSERQPEGQRRQAKALRCLDAGRVVARPWEVGIDGEGARAEEVTLPLDGGSEEAGAAQLSIDRAQSALGAQGPAIDRFGAREPCPRRRSRGLAATFGVCEPQLGLLRPQSESSSEPRLVAAAPRNEGDVDEGCIDGRRAAIAGNALEVRQRLRHIADPERREVEPIGERVGRHVDRSRPERVESAGRCGERPIEDGA